MALPAGGRRRLPVRIQTCAQPRKRFRKCGGAPPTGANGSPLCCARDIPLSGIPYRFREFALLDADGDHSRAKRGGFLAKCQITAAENGLDAHDNAHKNAHAKFAYRDTVDALIDYAYGRYNIHAYTIEVYSPGKSEDGDISSCKWENTMPEATWVFYSCEEIRDTLGLDPDAITDSDGVGLAEGEGLWFYTSSTNQMVNRAPEEQDVMVRGCRDAILTMMESEPNGKGYQNPGFYK